MSDSKFRAAGIGIVLAGVLVWTNSFAAAPRQTVAFGLALGATPDVARAFFAEHYAPCHVARSSYRNHPSGTTPQLAELAINAGLAAHDPASLSPCTYSPAGDGMMDAVEARFTHPDVDPKQPLYWLQVFRSYPDVVHATPPRIRTSFDEVRNELFRTYGKPNDERTERIVSYAASTERSLGVVKQVKREDYLVRYLWSAKGRLTAADPDAGACDCTDRYVEAVIEISQSPATKPPNKRYALSLRLLVEDPTLRRRQDAWNAQRQSDPHR
ncbi:MAG TPA: hypothetical protein VJV77_16815 [Casimicrobiaceae bacterium]|nr:hypothetical protein [Casimicrobiaceae bacterium]